jgi:hypothetical protein
LVLGTVAEIMAKITVVVTIHYSIMPMPVKTSWVLPSRILVSLTGLAKILSPFGSYFRIVFESPQTFSVTVLLPVSSILLYLLFHL